MPPKTEAAMLVPRMSLSLIAAAAPVHVRPADERLVLTKACGASRQWREFRSR